MPNEHSSLLPRSPSPVQKEASTVSIWRSLAVLSKQSIPICLSFALQNAVQAISVLTAGRLGSFELAVTSYGFLFVSCTGSMVAIGGATALDTLCAQAFASQTLAEHPEMLGVLLQKCLLVLLGIFIILIVPVWASSAHIFTALGQEAEFAYTTGRFVLFMIPAGILQVVAECLRKFLQVQGESNLAGMATAVASVMAVVVNFVLTIWTSLGLWGVPIAFGIYQLVTTLILVGLIAYKSAVRKSWRSPTMATLKDLSRLLFYAVTGIMTIATEWWSFEILAMMAARLDPTSIAAHSILLSSDLLFTTVSLGISVATSHHIGGLLGANNGLGARKAAVTPFLLSILLGAIEFLGIILARNVYGRLFTTDQLVIIKTAEILPLMAGFQVLDLSNGGAGGILRGAGKNHLSGACNFLGYYGVGLTTAWFLCFRHDYGVYGLWAGIITGSGALLIMQCGCILSIRWKQLASEISTFYAE